MTTGTTNYQPRFEPLTFQTKARQLVPPGYYMLFIPNRNGVPSVAAMVRVQ